MPSTDIIARRLAHQRLTGPGYASAFETVARMGAVQAQDYGAAKWAVALRTPGTTDADVERLLAGGQILRTHVLRPTWHLVSPADIRWMLDLTAPRIRAQMATMDRALGLDDGAVKRSNATIARALRDGPRTRAELSEALQRARIDTTLLQRLTNLMIRAELDGVVCSGPRRGKQFTYALLDVCAPKAHGMSREESLAELAARYFVPRGPATAHDFAWWSGLTVADARRGAEAAGGVLRHETIDGHVMWSAAREQGAARNGAEALLLPNFDEYYIAYKDRSHILGVAMTEGARAWSPSLTDNLVSIDGRLVGSWKRAVSSKGVSIVATIVRPLSAADRARLEQQAKRYAAFLGVPLVSHAIELRGVTRGRPSTRLT